jgi:hypothetical protein
VRPQVQNPTTTKKRKKKEMKTGQAMSKNLKYFSEKE